MSPVVMSRVLKFFMLGNEKKTFYFEGPNVLELVKMNCFNKGRHLNRPKSSNPVRTFQYTDCSRWENILLMCPVATKDL